MCIVNKSNPYIFAFIIPVFYNIVIPASVLASLSLASVTRPLNSLSLSFRLIKWTSPVVQKQHFEVVFAPPAVSLPNK